MDAADILGKKTSNSWQSHKSKMVPKKNRNQYVCMQWKITKNLTCLMINRMFPFKTSWLSKIVRVGFYTSLLSSQIAGSSEKKKSFYQLCPMINWLSSGKQLNLS